MKMPGHGKIDLGPHRKNQRHQRRKYEHEQNGFSQHTYPITNASRGAIAQPEFERKLGPVALFCSDPAGLIVSSAWN